MTLEGAEQPHEVLQVDQFEWANVNTDEKSLVTIMLDECSRCCRVKCHRSVERGDHIGNVKAKNAVDAIKENWLALGVMVKVVSTLRSSTTSVRPTTYC